MRSRVRALSAAALVALMLGSLSPTARTEENESFGIAPFPEQVDGLDRATFGVPLEAGARFQDAVRVYNRTDQPLDLILYSADAQAGIDGSVSVAFRGSSPQGVGAWIELAQEQLNLPARVESIVRFTITVQTSEPSPQLGAIVVENASTEVRSDSPQRLSVLVRTLPASSPTTSQRVRPFLLRSPWIVLALLGLLAAALLVWVVTRRARRPQDAITAPGELSQAAAPVPEGSKPKLHRLGTAARESEHRGTTRALQATLTRPEGEGAATGPELGPEPPDDRPLLDLVLPEEVPDELEDPGEGDAPDDHAPPAADVPAERTGAEPPTPEPTPPPDEPKTDPAATPPPARRQPKAGGKKLDYIPLDEL